MAGRVAFVGLFARLLQNFLDVLCRRRFAFRQEGRVFPFACQDEDDLYEGYAQDDYRHDEVCDAVYRYGAVELSIRVRYRCFYFIFDFSEDDNVHLLLAAFLRVYRRIFFHLSALVDFVLNQVRNVLGRFFIVLSFVPLFFGRRLAVFFRLIKVVILEVTVGRLTTFAFYLFGGFENRFAQWASHFARGRVPGVVNGRSPAFLAFLRDRCVRRNGILRVLTRQDGREEVARAQPCMDGFVRRLSRRFVLNRGQRIAFYLVLISEFRIHFGVNRRASRRTTQRSQDGRWEVRRAIFKASVWAGRVVRGLLGREARFRVHFRVGFKRFGSNVFRRNLRAGRVDVTNSP